MQSEKMLYYMKINKCEGFTHEGLLHCALKTEIQAHLTYGSPKHSVTCILRVVSPRAVPV